ncbi:MAG: methyltransferase domain-containing protein [Candidatus Latescibacter sp.]|nr:methyltransferase domain-containing protein [Candidatus Latescibacter sp.]
MNDKKVPAQNSNNHLQKAESWASSLWKTALARWPDRIGQDKNYRLHVVHPTLDELLRERFRRGIHILDLGCGDCSLLDDPRFSGRIRPGGSYLGIDISGELIDKASARHKGEGIRFLRGDLADQTLSNRITGVRETWDVVLSVFVIQEVPDLDTFLENLAHIASPGSLVIVVTVHPAFAEWLLDEGRLRIESSLQAGFESEALWRWAGYYPIVDEPMEPFYLPYFHRSVEDYREAFTRTGLKVCDIRNIPDRERDLPRLRELRITPFFQFETNLYWPRIAEEPSALVIAALKEDLRGKDS